MRHQNYGFRDGELIKDIVFTLKSSQTGVNGTMCKGQGLLIGFLS